MRGEGVGGEGVGGEGVGGEREGEEGLLYWKPWSSIPTHNRCWFPTQSHIYVML